MTELLRRAILAVLLWIGGAEPGWAAEPGEAEVFAPYRSAAGFVLFVPQTWAHRDFDGGVEFADRDERIDIAISTAPTAPTAADGLDQVKHLAQSTRSLRVLQISDVQMPAGSAMRISFFCASTIGNGDRHRINDRYLFFKNGMLVSIDLSAPEGSDRAVQWALIARSFRWR